ncbi:malonyl CoA-acyl carrier protein transacylase [Suhomyces tanzawaensis NRRL Y-17324]|uniref:[acyl-carrier-protein] S-malonyltransferase n=1 Tax=Suhomyces tanzawaensis NRRL Y-17324 TaxID=984487 RepID=A0A1E4SKQ2_9ASCO|nr:malonyl CoA-acyl carrier protein transacylase [Suhomyces tanzawaensis NRRL Y-17324]ODV80095.1 malonyl CoA-acyl carrier protein transacylase [Suhomyces tanzawaensis NRRL Y-17324]
MRPQYTLALPGQGVVRSTLLSPYKKYRSLYKPLLQEIDSALNEPISIHLEAENGASEWLQHTSNAQPAILATSYIIHHILKHEHGIDLAGNALYLMGHSLGEYTALVLSGVFDLASGVQIVRKRGQLMEDVVESASGAAGASGNETKPGYSMLALLFASSHKLLPVRARAIEQGLLANDNSSTQLVISGETGAVDKFIESANSASRIISRATRLPVSIPFHNRILAQIEPALANYINTFKHSEPAVPIVSNLTGKPVLDAASAIANVVLQTHSTVQWAQSVDFVHQQGVDQMVCLGPGKVLEGLLRRSSILGIAVDTPDTFGGLSEFFNQL